MAIRHAKGITGHPGKGGDVGDLVNDRIIHFVKELFGRIDPCWDTHPFLVRGWNFPDRIEDP
jgi:hypothetical protein